MQDGLVADAGPSTTPLETPQRFKTTKQGIKLCFVDYTHPSPEVVSPRKRKSRTSLARKGAAKRIHFHSPSEGSSEESYVDDSDNDKTYLPSPGYDSGRERVSIHESESEPEDMFPDELNNAMIDDSLPGFGRGIRLPTRDVGK